MKSNITIRKPSWLRRPLPRQPEYEGVRNLIKRNRLHTVCQEAGCPNMWECFSRKTATFLIMGPRCTRNCGFCAVEHGNADPPDTDEPTRVALAAKEMNFSYVVITSVTRDDLPDGGARFFRETIYELRKQIPDVRIETLIPDFNGDWDALRSVMDARPDVLNHNIETCENLYPEVRPEASYARSLDLLKTARAHDPAVFTKSGMMLGMGETDKDIVRTFKDLRDAGVQMLTLGQYLQPAKRHLAVDRFVTPEEFDALGKTALDMGFSQAASGPLVRSSYRAEQLHADMKTRENQFFFSAPAA